MKSYHYHAFISYSHSDSGSISYHIQKAIETIGSPWYLVAKKNLNVFRDETNLSANPSLWSNIEAALRNTDYFILLASPKATESKWIMKEVEWWLSNKSLDNLLIAVVNGNIYWMEEINDFNWQKSNCLPAFLKGKFSNEPLYIDLRPYYTAGNKNIQEDIGFKSQIVKIIGAIIKKPPREIFSDERRRRNNIQKFLGAVGFLLIGLVLALLFMFLNIRNSYNTIQNQLAANLSNNSKAAIANNQLLFGLHYTAEAVANCQDDNLKHKLLTDIEPFLPQAYLMNNFVYEGNYSPAFFTKDGKKLITSDEWGIDILDLISQVTADK